MIDYETYVQIRNYFTRDHLILQRHIFYRHLKTDGV